MRKILSVLSILFLLTSNSWATVGWNKSIPATSENPQAISPDVIENNTALDLMLQDYRSGHVTVSLISTSEIDIGTGGVMLQNSGGSVRLMVANTTVTAMSSTNIDTGSISPSSTYYIYAYASSTTATTFSVIYSASSTSPTGITYYQQIGKFTTDGSSNFISASSNTNTQIGLGTWSSKSFGSPYQAGTDGFFMGSCANTGSGSTGISCITDSSSSPSTVRQESAISANTGGILSCISPVKKNDYYEITEQNGCTSGEVEYFLPLGS